MAGGLSHRYGHKLTTTLYLKLHNTFRQVLLTGGYFTFGFAINSDRVFMLVIYLANCLFLYLIARKLTSSKIWAIITVLFFGLSPLGILLQRRVLLVLDLYLFRRLLRKTFLLSDSLWLYPRSSNSIQRKCHFLRARNCLLYSSHRAQTTSSTRHRPLDCHTRDAPWPLYHLCFYEKWTLPLW